MADPHRVQHAPASWCGGAVLSVCLKIKSQTEPSKTKSGKHLGVAQTLNHPTLGSTAGCSTGSDLDIHKVSRVLVSVTTAKPEGACTVPQGTLPGETAASASLGCRCGLVGAGWACLRSCLRSTKAEQVQAHLGTASLLGVGGSPVKLGLRKVALHPRYNPGILDFDVALLELTRPLVFNKYIQPVCLPLAIQKFPVGRKCMISGWGNMQEGNGERVPSGAMAVLSWAWPGRHELGFPHLGLSV